MTRLFPCRLSPLRLRRFIPHIFRHNSSLSGSLELLWLPFFGQARLQLLHLYQQRGDLHALACILSFELGDLFVWLHYSMLRRAIPPEQLRTGKIACGT